MLYAAETQSIVGDQLARVALSVLVFDRTASAMATAATYAATYLPAILGGSVLARIGDRLPRRRVMVGCDLVRAMLFAIMSIAAIPLPIVVCLLIAAVFVGPAFSASEVSYLASVLDEDRFRAATGLRMVTNQCGQVLGFAAGGVLIAILGPHGALLLDAATYLVSAVVIGAALRPDPERRAARSLVAVAEPGPVERPGSRSSNRLWRDRRLRLLLALSCLAGFFVVPEGLAVPFGAHAGASTAQIGLLLAALPLGGAIGAVLLTRVIAPSRRSRTAALMAIGCGLPLIVPFFVGPWPVALVCWLVSGLLGAYQVEVMTAFVRRLPDVSRARLVGVASALLLGAQGLGLIAFGALANASSPPAAIALAGAVGSAGALALGIAAKHAVRTRAVRVGAHRVADRPAFQEDSVVTDGAPALSGIAPSTAIHGVRADLIDGAAHGPGTPECVHGGPPDRATGTEHGMNGNAGTRPGRRVGSAHGDAGPGREHSNEYAS